MLMLRSSSRAKALIYVVAALTPVARAAQRVALAGRAITNAPNDRQDSSGRNSPLVMNEPGNDGGFETPDDAECSTRRGWGGMRRRSQRR